jgi:hypothetical protein
MKGLKYLNGVLTVIAVCLVMLTLQQMNIIPAARAGEPNTGSSNFALVPLNPDGTVEVRIKSFDDVIDVNLERVAGSSCYQGIPVVQRK